MLRFQEPVQRGDSADQFFMERIDDLVRIEEMIINADENRDAVDSQECQQLIQRLNSQSGPYGHRRKQLIKNLFNSIVEMALPGFIEYLFYGFENKENENNFFSPENCPETFDN